MKAKYSILTIVFIFFMILPLNCRADDFEVNIKQNDEFVWEVVNLEEDKLEDIFGKDWEDYLPFGADKIGAKRKIVVSDVEEDWFVDDSFEIILSIWNFTDELFEDKPDISSTSYILPKDPKVYYIDGTTEAIPEETIYVLTPVIDYLEDFEWDFGYVTYENHVRKMRIEGPEGKEYNLIYTFDLERGFHTTYKITDKDDEIIFVYTYISPIPGYEMNSLILIMTVSLVGIVLITLRKKRVKFTD